MFGNTAVIQDTVTSPVDILLSAAVDGDWVRRKFRTEFSPDVMHKLTKAVYGIGQREGQWFSGGSELSGQEASRLLDYAILIELLLRHRKDLGDYQPDLRDCRAQLRMQIDRYTEGQPERVAAQIDETVGKLGRQITVPGSAGCAG